MDFGRGWAPAPQEPDIQKTGSRSKEFTSSGERKKNLIFKFLDLSSCQPKLLLFLWSLKKTSVKSKSPLALGSKTLGGAAQRHASLVNSLIYFYAAMGVLT